MFLTDRWIYGAQVVSYRSREQDGQTGISPPVPLVLRGIARWLAADSGRLQTRPCSYRSCERCRR